MRRRLIENIKKGGGEIFNSVDNIDPSKAEVCDVVFANKATEELRVARMWDTAIFPPAQWEPIGVVVIPGEHGVLKDGTGKVNQCGVMSIISMSYSTPEKGDASNQYLYWGYRFLDISGKSDGLGRFDSYDGNGLINYNRIVVTSDNTSNEATGFSSSASVYIPNQRSVGGVPQRDKSPYAPSPYLGSDYKSGSYNESYGTTKFDTPSNFNALADFKGIVNTKIITDLVTVSNWKSASTISNSYSSGNYPAACCCARFKTTGTKAFVECSTNELRNGTGFWYLPAIGELGYIVPRLYDINDIISKLYNAYGVGVKLETVNIYWSSTEISSSNAYYVYPGQGTIYQSVNKQYDQMVRAFMRLSTPPEPTETAEL